MNDTSSSEAPTADLRAAARELSDAGLCPLPVKADGTKAPDVRSWTQYKVTASTPEEHDQWFNDGRRTGIGTVYGQVAGNVLMIEFEGRAVTEGVVDEVTEIMVGSGLGPVWEAIMNGWATESPSGGIHVRVRIADGPVPPSAKLASRLAREDEYTDQERQRLAEKPGIRIVRVLVETRGEGAYGVVEPSHGAVHATGKPYRRIAGSPATIPTIEAEYVNAVLTICTMVDTVPQPEKVKTAPRPRKPPAEGEIRPGDDFENKVDWPDIIGDELDAIFTRGRTTYWRRKGKNTGISATTGHAADRDRLWVFSTSTSFEACMAYDKFAAYTHLNHGGNFKEAAAELRRRNYGTPPPRRRLSSVSSQSRPFIDGANALDSEPQTDPDTEFQGPDLHVVAPGRPELDITNEAEAIEGILEIMAAEQLPDLYKRSGGPSWVYEDDQGNPLIKQLAADNLRAYMADHVTTYRVVRDPATDGTQEVRELLMPKTCGTILGRKDWPLLPLRGIVTSPVVRPDGSLLQAPGYDKDTGLYLQPRVKLRRLRPEVTDDALEKAKEIILGQMLADFPWKDQSDKAHFLGALLTPILRPYFYGTTPMFVFTATTMGSGKSLLKDIFLYLYGVSETPWPENDTELRKSITTQLYTTGQPVVVLDNLPNGYVIKSPILSSLLTAEFWGDRVLGSTASVTMPNDRLWIATGNGLRTGGDNGRRVVWVRLDPDCPDPDQRDGYKVGDLRPWLRANASTVVAALVTMVRSWLAAGGKPVRVRKGDYSEWASMIAGILKYLDVPGWMADRADATEMDDETLEWSAFLTMWRNKLGDQAVTTGSVLGSVSDHTPRLKSGELPSANVLGGWLKARDGRYFGTHKVVRVWDSHRCQNTWRVDVHQDRGTGRDEL